MKEVVSQSSENGWLAFVDKKSSIDKFDRVFVFIA